MDQKKCKIVPARVDIKGGGDELGLRIFLAGYSKTVKQKKPKGSEQIQKSFGILVVIKEFRSRTD